MLYTHTRSVTYGSLLIIYIPTERRRKKLIIKQRLPVFRDDITRVLEPLPRSKDIERICHRQKVQCPSSICALIPVRSFDIYPRRVILRHYLLSFQHLFVFPCYYLVAASLSHLNSPSPHLTLSTLENRRSFFSPAESSAASRETAYGAVLSATRQALFTQLSAD